MKTLLNTPLKNGQGLSTRHFLRFCMLALVPAMLWTGCKPNAKTVAETNPVGTYNLVSVHGNQVPCTVKHEGAEPSIKSGTFIINADGTCSSKIQFTLPGRGDATREVKASYTRQGAQLTMKWQGAGITTGTVEGDTFTMNNEGMIFAYRK